MKQYPTLSYQDFKTIKYDLKYADTLFHKHAVNLDDITRLVPENTLNSLM